MVNVNKNQMATLPYIIAVDFDGTLVEDKFPDIGKKRESVWNAMKHARERGAKIILWTSRDHHNLDAAVEYCRQQGFEFDAINENLKECREMFDNDTRKVFANEYWEDKAIAKFCDLYATAYTDIEESFDE